MAMADVPNLIPAMPELFLALVAMALLLLGAFQKEGPAEEAKTATLISYLCVIALLLAVLLVMTVTRGRVLAFNALFLIDSFTMFFKVLVLVASALSVVIARHYMQDQGMARYEFGILILFAAIGMMMMISANNLISLYLGLELQSLSLYVLAAFQRDDTRSTEAGLKYFVLGALASGLLLYGASLVYGLKNCAIPSQ